MDSRKIISFISERKRALNLSNNDIANKLGYSSQLIFNWEKGKSIPDLSIVYGLCNELNVSLEEFFECKVNSSILDVKETPFDINVFSENLKKLRIVNSITQKDLADKVGVSYATIIAWEKGKSTPNLDQFITLKELYQLSYSDLYYGRNSLPKPIVKSNKLKILVPALSCLVAIGLATGVTIGVINYNNNPNPPIETEGNDPKTPTNPEDSDNSGSNTSDDNTGTETDSDSEGSGSNTGTETGGETDSGNEGTGSSETGDNTGTETGGESEIGGNTDSGNTEPGGETDSGNTETGGSETGSEETGSGEGGSGEGDDNEGQKDDPGTGTSTETETQTPVKYFVRFFDDDKTTTLWSYEFNKGEQVHYEGNTPSKVDDKYIYTFKGWDKDLDGEIDELPESIDSNIDFYAVYDKEEIPASEVNDFVISTNGGGGSISSYTGTDPIVVIPEKINGVSITEINNQAFKGCMTIKEVYLPNTIRNIGSDAFSGCYQLEKAVLPEEVNYLGSAAFFKCRNLKELTLPKKANELGYSFVYGCSSLTSISLPIGISKIDNSTFSECTSLQYIDIKEGVTSINNAFDNTAIEEIKLPSTLRNISSNAFGGMKKLKHIIFPNGLTSIPSGNLPKNLEYAVIPKSVIYFELSEAQAKTNKTKLFYEGSEEDFSKIIFPDLKYNDISELSNVYCYSDTNKSHCWHYVNNVPTLY